jgi:hypothetical protein
MNGHHKQAPPASDEALAGDTAQGFGGKEENSAAIVADDNATRKELSSMKAKAALAGCELHELAAGGFLLCRWGLSRELPSLGAVAALLRSMTGARQ